MDQYVPGTEWMEVDPASAGFSPPALAEAIAFAVAHECDWPRSMMLPDGRYVGTARIGDVPPYDQALGPIRPRGGPNGMVLRAGRMVASWGDTARADMTFSVAKSYLALLAGLAVADGRIPSVDQPVVEAAPAAGFDTPQNRAITWRHMLQQTSEWEGTLWDRPDSVDHNRQVFGADNSGKGTLRTLERPGARWEYNDVRVNALSLALLHVWKRPLPDVLRDRVMRPIGASPTWEWRGYRNSTVDVGTGPIESVSGGGHWGGGMFISSQDHARLGLLIQRRGRWGGATLLPEPWVAEMLAPSPANPAYGYLWWLNTGRALFPAASEASVFAIGAGGHLVWIDAALDLVMVARWVDRPACDGLIARVLASLA